MRLSLLPVIPFLVSGLLAVVSGCAGTDDSDSASADLVGGIATARACAIESTYLAAPLEAFHAKTFASLPSALRSRLQAEWGSNSFESVSTFNVPNVGQLYVLEQATDTAAQETSIVEFFNSAGEPVATATTTASGATFRLPGTSSGDGGLGSSGSALSCRGSAADAGPSSWDGGGYHPGDAGYPTDGGYYHPGDAGYTSYDAGSTSYDAGYIPDGGR